MSKRCLIYCFAALAALMCTATMRAQTMLPTDMPHIVATGTDELMGTARYVGLCGAMTAVGGDPSAVKLNPAGLGVYRHSQFSIAAEGQFRKFWQEGSMDRGRLYDRWHLSQISYVFAIKHPERLAGVISNNIMLSYANRADILQVVKLNDREARLPNEDWIETGVDEYGYRHDADIHYAMNISNRVYWGVGITMEWFRMRQTLNRWEYTAADKRGMSREYEWRDTDQGQAVAWAGSVGVLVHPIRELRIGLAIESPMVGRMKETEYFSESFHYCADTSRDFYFESPDMYSSWRMVTPLKGTAGLAWQWKDRGLLSLQYDLQYHKLSGVAHTARAGIELVMGRHWMLDAGYSYATLFSRQRIAFGVNYMGNMFRVGIAYTYSWSNAGVADVNYYTYQGLIRANENKVVFTFQWNS